jgi:DNA-binding NarL/FixJ family response regulator
VEPALLLRVICLVDPPGCFRRTDSLATGTVPLSLGKRPLPAYLPAAPGLCLIRNVQSASSDTQSPASGSSPSPELLPPEPNSVLNSDLSVPLEGSRASDGTSNAATKISVILVTAERLFGLGLARLLVEDDRIHVSGVYQGEPELLVHCVATPADVVLIDLELSRVDGIDLVRMLSSECPSTKSLILTANPDWRVRPAMIAGAVGVLLKDSSPEAIQAAVVSVHLGDQVLCTEAAQWFLGEERSTHLTQRESDVLRMVAQGANNAEIASELHIGQKTVRNYVSRLYRKLDLNNRAQLAMFLERTDMARAVRAYETTTENEPSVHSL